jgi:hypothetical protein
MWVLRCRRPANTVAHPSLPWPLFLPAAAATHCCPTNATQTMPWYTHIGKKKKKKIAL